MLFGIDIGGTAIKVGLVTEEGKLLKKDRMDTPDLTSQKTYDALIKLMHKLLAEQKLSAEDCSGIGLGVPGPVNAQGHLMMTPNINLNLEGLGEALHEAFPDAQLAAINDANAAALGESWQGSGKDCDNSVFITLGTGVGSGIIVNGKIVSGAHGAAGEAGHICVNPDEIAACGCGRRGCLEQYASARGLVRIYLQECAVHDEIPVDLEGRGDALAVFRAYEQGDEAARMAIYTMNSYLGKALSAISCVCDPDKFIIGGGMSGSFKLFIDELTACYRSWSLDMTRDTPIVKAQLGNDAGIIGAAYYVYQNK